MWKKKKVRRFWKRIERRMRKRRKEEKRKISNEIICLR
jgi:hypothetical protein